MLYALVVVCLAAEPTCDVEHAIFAEQSPPLFNSETECHHGAIAHLQNERIPSLKAETDYQVVIECSAAEPQRDL
jgi:hypothetical protein